MVTTTTTLLQLYIVMLVLLVTIVSLQVFTQFSVATVYTQMLGPLHAHIAHWDIIVRSQSQQRLKC